MTDSISKSFFAAEGHRITAWPEHQTEMSVDNEARWSEYEPWLFQSLEVGKILIKKTTEQPPSR